MGDNTGYFQKCIHFIESIGITIIEKQLDDNCCFLPGLLLGGNTIYVDYSKLKYPGDILHEAGHIAVTCPQKRKLIGSENIDKEWPTQGDEIAAILWSYAALKYLDIPIEFVFHENGYKGHSEWYINAFSSQNYIGLPLLQWFGMSYSTNEIEQENLAFPVMKCWMRQ